MLRSPTSGTDGTVPGQSRLSRSRALPVGGTDGTAPYKGACLSRPGVPFGDELLIRRADWRDAPASMANGSLSGRRPPGVAPSPANRFPQNF
jgi:hypothetical protein